MKSEVSNLRFRQINYHKSLVYDVNSKFLEAKDIVDIAIVHQIFSKIQLLRLIHTLYNSRIKSNAQERVFPIALYKIFVLYEDFEIFEYLVQHETHLSGRDLLSLVKYSINNSRTMFTIYLAKTYSKQLEPFEHDIIQDLLLYIENCVGMHSLFELSNFSFRSTPRFS